jgi:hypothetical protein
MTAILKLGRKQFREELQRLLAQRDHFYRSRKHIARDDEECMGDTIYIYLPIAFSG